VSALRRERERERERGGERGTIWWRYSDLVVRLGGDLVERRVAGSDGGVLVGSELLGERVVVVGGLMNADAGEG